MNMLQVILLILGLFAQILDLIERGLIRVPEVKKLQLRKDYDKLAKACHDALADEASEHDTFVHPQKE